MSYGEKSELRRAREKGKHDRLARRLGLILTRLNIGEKLYSDELCREFGVSERTVRRDFTERLNYLPIEHGDRYYYLDPKLLGRLSSHSFLLLLSNMGLKSLFSDRDYLSTGILNSGSTPPFLFRNPWVEAIDDFACEFEILIEAIQLKLIVAFTCEGQHYDGLHCYRLLNDAGIWYLIATSSGQLHRFRVANISELVRYDTRYTPDPSIAARV